MSLPFCYCSGCHCGCSIHSHWHCHIMVVMFSVIIFMGVACFLCGHYCCIVIAIIVVIVSFSRSLSFSSLRCVSLSYRLCSYFDFILLFYILSSNIIFFVLWWYLISTAWPTYISVYITAAEDLFVNGRNPL